MHYLQKQNLVNNQLKVTNKVLGEYKNQTQEENWDNISHLEEFKKFQQRALTNLKTTLGLRKKVRRL